MQKLSTKKCININELTLRTTSALTCMDSETPKGAGILFFLAVFQVCDLPAQPVIGRVMQMQPSKL